MEKLTLPNGLTLILDHRPCLSVAIHAAVAVGSNNEEPGYRGISHFIEHLAFDATKKFGDNAILANQIEKYGGELNAYTSNERTCYYAIVPKDNFKQGFEVITEILLHPQFLKEHIEVEKKVILEEIKMTTDEPRFYQWTLFMDALYLKHPAKYPVIGYPKDIKSFTKEAILKYYHQHYIAKNTVLTLVGSFPDNTKQIVASAFANYNDSPGKKRPFIPEKLDSNREKREKRDILQSYVVLGFPTVPRMHADSYVLDVIRGILGRGQSGTLFSELRTKHALVYDIGVQHEPRISYGLFAVYFNSDKKNERRAISLVLKELDKIQKITSDEFSDAINFICGEYALLSDDKQRWSDMLSLWQLVGDVDSAEHYSKKIQSVTLEQLKAVAKKYFKKHVIIAIH